MSSGMEKILYPLSAGLYVGADPWHMQISDSKIVTAITIPMLKEFYAKEPVKVPVTAFNPETSMPMSYDDTFITGINGPDGTFYRFTNPGKAVSDEYTFLSRAEYVKGLEPWIENDQIVVKSATRLFNGACDMLSASVGSAGTVNGKDELWQYIMLYNWHNGDGGGIAFACHRTDCANMMNSAINRASKAGKLLKFRHSPLVSFTYEKVLETVDLVNAQFIATLDQLKVLERHGVDTKAIKRFQFAWSSLDAVDTALAKFDQRQALIDSEELEVKASVRDKVIEDLEARFNDRNAGTYGKSLYDLYNAATNRVTHGSEQRQLTGQDLFGDNLFGNGKNANIRALEVCLAMASGK